MTIEQLPLKYRTPVLLAEFELEMFTWSEERLRATIELHREGAHMLSEQIRLMQCALRNRS